jgi:protein TonB
VPRLIWALILTFVAHLVFFLLQVPESEEVQLALAGSGQVSVRIAHSSPKEEDRVVSAPVPDPVPEPEVTEDQEETAAPPVQPPEEKISRQVVEEKTVAEKTAAVVDEGRPAVSENSPAPEEKTQVAEAAPSVPIAVGSEPAESGTPAAQAVLQAEPLASFNRPPAYQALARRRGWEGTVVLEVDVDGDGRVQAVRIQTSSSYALLDREALDAVGKWRFTPGSRNGTAVESKVLVPVHFMLQGK